MDFIKEDPLYRARRNISKEIYKHLHKKYILFISHSLGGGTEVATRDLAALLKKEEEDVLILECVDERYILKR